MRSLKKELFSQAIMNMMIIYELNGYIYWDIWLMYDMYDDKWFLPTNFRFFLRIFIVGNAYFPVMYVYDEHDKG